MNVTYVPAGMTSCAANNRSSDRHDRLAGGQRTGVGCPPFARLRRAAVPREVCPDLSSATAHHSASTLRITGLSLTCSRSGSAGACARHAQHQARSARPAPSTACTVETRAAARGCRAPGTTSRVRGRHDEGDQNRLTTTTVD
jgi:hypothetical protein